MKVHTHYLNAVILFALAFLLAAATGPVTAQQPGPPDSVEAGTLRWLRLSEQIFRLISGAAAGFKPPRSAEAG
jgi:heme A synthase